MKRLLILLLLLLGSAAASFARDSARGFCEEGNRPVVTSGLNSTTRVQASHPSCTVTVYVHGGGLATIYSDNNNTPLANPFTGQSAGQWQFYANDGRYDVTMSSAGFSQTVTYSDIILCDPFVAGAVCSGGSGGGSHNLLSTTHLDTVPESPPVRGDLITAQNVTSPSGVTPAWAALPIGTNGQVLTSTGVDAVWGNLTAGTNITITTVGGNTTINSTGGGGSGCTLPGTDTGILTEHPVGTCYNSTHATWDDATASSTVNGQILLIGDGTNVATAPAAGNSLKEAFVFGDHNTITGIGASHPVAFMFGAHSTINGCTVCAAFGDFNSLGGSASITEEYVFGDDNTVTGSYVSILGAFNVVNGTDMTVIGETNHINSAGTGLSTNVGGQSIIIEDNATATFAGANAIMLDTQVLGSFDTFTVGQPTGGFNNQLNCLHGVGGSNTFTVTGGLAASHNIQSVSWVGKTNTFTANGFNINTIIVAGNANTLNATSVNLSNSGVFGKSNTLANCADCFILGENVSLSTNTTLAIGMSAAPEISITAGHIALGAHLDQTATGKFAGSCAMAAATTCTFSVAAAYSGTPLCVTSIDAASTVPATANVAKCSVSGTTVTITAGISNSLTWDAILVGNPN